MVEILTYLAGLVSGIILTVLTGAGRRIWDKHGAGAADKWPTIDKIGLSESRVNNWLSKGIFLSEQLEARWNEKIRKANITPSDVREIRNKTEETVEQFRQMTIDPPDDIPVHAVVELEDFIDRWGSEAQYFEDAKIPQSSFNSKGDRIRAGAKQLKKQFSKFQSEWEKGELEGEDG